MVFSGTDLSPTSPWIESNCKSPEIVMILINIRFVWGNYKPKNIEPHLWTEKKLLEKLFML